MSNHRHDALFPPHAGSHAPFVVLPDGAEISHVAFHLQAMDVAAVLGHVGLHSGDRLAVQLAKSVPMRAVHAACLRIGVVFLPLNTAYSPTEVAHFLADSGAALMLCDTAAEADLAPVAASGGTRLLTLDADGTGHFAALLPAGIGEVPVIERGPDDLAALPYTSGKVQKAALRQELAGLFTT